LEVEQVKFTFRHSHEFKQIGLLQTQVHQRKCKRRPIAPRRLFDDPAQPPGVEKDLFRVSLFVQYQVGSDRHL
jgi:hypothetical protein